MRRSAFVCLIFAGMWIATVAIAGTPKVSATVKTLSPTSRLVHIANRDRVTYRTFIVQSWNTPKIVRARATKPCPVERFGASIGVAFNWRYRATCETALAPGKTLDIRLTTSRGSGRIEVFVVVNGVLSRISK
ncbi:MAG: hypothetical protein ACRDPX_05395 [Gaiellaceae bacterium]